MLLRFVRGKGEKNEVILSKLLTSNKAFVGVFIGLLLGVVKYSYIQVPKVYPERGR